MTMDRSGLSGWVEWSKWQWQRRRWKVVSHFERLNWYSDFSSPRFKYCTKTNVESVTLKKCRKIWILKRTRVKKWSVSHEYTFQNVTKRFSPLGKRLYEYVLCIYVKRLLSTLHLMICLKRKWCLTLMKYGFVAQLFSSFFLFFCWKTVSQTWFLNLFQCWTLTFGVISERIYIAGHN